MTTVQNHQPQESAAASAADSGVSFIRLLRVEARKLVDTRSGRWLIGISLAMAVAVGIIAAVWVDITTMMAMFANVMTSIMLLLPVVAILAVTTEWSTGSVMSTFTLEPRRNRVICAKAIVAVALGVAATVIACLIALAAMGIAATQNPQVSWALGALEIGGMLLAMAVMMLQAVAFGLAALNTPAAIVAYFVLPTVWTMAEMIVPWMADNSAWLNLQRAMAPFMNGAITGSDWAHLAVASVIWVLLPALVGLVRVQRTEVA